MAKRGRFTGFEDPQEEIEEQAPDSRPAGPIKVRILTAQHNDAGKIYVQNDILETDSVTASWLVERGVAERV